MYFLSCVEIKTTILYSIGSLIGILPNLGAQESVQLEQFPYLQVKLISSWAHQFASLGLSDF